MKGGAQNPNDWDNMREMFREFVATRRLYPFEGQNDAHHVSYKRFRRRFTRRSGTSGPDVSTPLSTERQRQHSFEFDAVCQRLDLDSPPRHYEAAQRVPRGNLQETTPEGGASHCGAVTSPNSPHATSAGGQPAVENPPEQGWIWRAGVQERGNAQQTVSDERRCDLLPFAVIEEPTVRLQGKSATKLAAPSLLNDYYTNVLDCRCDDTIALALGSSVYLWNSETRTFAGYLEPSPPMGHHWSVSSLCWSTDGRALCIGTKRGEIQLWDVEKQTMRRLPSHSSGVGALSWKQQLLSSGSVLGSIHHLDPRAPAPLVGAAVQTGGICSLQWSPGNERLASGTTDGLLSIWDGDVAGLTSSKRPVATMKQPSAVKAMGWCPWQRDTIATGGGWKDGELRIWDARSTTCVMSASTNSQICSLQWAEKKRYLVTGHGFPHHQVLRWSWAFPSLNLIHQFTGHSHRVLHLALNTDATQIFSAGADQSLRIWDVYDQHPSAGTVNDVNLRSDLC